MPNRPKPRLGPPSADASSAGGATDKVSPPANSDAWSDFVGFYSDSVLGHAPKGGKAAKPMASAPSKGDGRGNVGPKTRCNLTHMKVGDSGASSIDKSSRALREDSSMKVLDLEDNKVGPPDARQLHVVAAKVLMKNHVRGSLRTSRLATRSMRASAPHY